MNPLYELIKGVTGVSNSENEFVAISEIEMRHTGGKPLIGGKAGEDVHRAVEHFRTGYFMLYHSKPFLGL